MAPPIVRDLGLADGPALLAVNDATPIHGASTVIFERSPDFFAWPDAVFERHRHAGAFVGDELVGYGMIAARTGWSPDGVRPFLYVGDARVWPTWQQRGLLGQIAAHLGERVWDDVDDGFAVVARGNRAGEAAAAWLDVNARLAFESTATLRVALIPPWLSPRGDRRIAVRRATKDDDRTLDLARERFLTGRPLAPVPGSGPKAGGVAWIAERRGVVVGALRSWDLGPAQRTRVIRYGPESRAARWIGRAAAIARPDIAPLPAPGGTLVAWTLAEVAVGEPGVLRALIGAVATAARAEGAHLLQLALIDGDPLEAALRGLPRSSFDSSVYRVRRRGRGARWAAPPYIDASWL